MFLKFEYKYYRFLFRISLLLLIVGTFIVSSKQLYANEIETSKSQLYQKGLVLRNEGKWQEAIECFTPLANKKNERAQHNLAWCYMKLDDEKNAYVWFQQANQQGFEPSTRNLKLMNLLFLLLPNEMLMHVVSYFSRGEVSAFNCVSRRTNRVIKAAVTRTNFLTSSSPYAREFLTLFKEMVFDPQPKALRLGQQAEVKKGSIEVHFRDTKHLKDIVEETPLIEAEDQVYFISDPEVKDGEELVANAGEINTKYFIYFTSDVPLKMTGRLHLSLSYAIVFPPQSNHNSLNQNTPGSLTCGKLTAFSDGNALADAIDTFDLHLFNIRTQDAYQLLEKRQQSRQKTPDIYPTLQELCPDTCLIASPTLQIIQDDYFYAEKPFIYVAQSIPAIVGLTPKLPGSSSCISYINPKIPNSGIYCEGPLTLMKRFVIHSDSDLTISGHMKLPDHGIKILSQGNMWLLYFNCIIGGEILIKGEGSMSMNGDHPQLLQNDKPAEMAEHDWQKLLTFWRERGLIH